MASMEGALLLLGLLMSFQAAGSQVICNMNCICLEVVGTFCNVEDQDLSGFGARLSTIQTGSFSQAGYINSVNLANNNPLTLESGSFIGLVNITSLDLSGNMISALPNGVFSPMARLQSLDLRRNSLSILNFEAFVGLTSLQQLNLQSNRLSFFPANDLLPLLPSLTTLQISGNPFDCDHPRIDELYFTLHSPSINVMDGMFVLCTNGTAVRDLLIVLPSPTSAPVFSVSSTQIMPEISSTSETSTVDEMSLLLPVRSSTSSTSFLTFGISGSSTASVFSVTLTDLAATTTTDLVATPIVSSAVPTTAFMGAPTAMQTATPTLSSAVPTAASIGAPTATPTPTPLSNTPTFCLQETTLSHVGYLVWPETASGSTAVIPCPNGPSGDVAQRMCLESGQWLTPADQDCAAGSATEQLLASITSVDVTESSSVELSRQLASLPPTATLTVQELDTVTSFAAHVVSAAGGNVEVLNNTLQAIDSVLGSSASSLSGQQGPELAARIRLLIDTILLDALSINATKLVLSFSHLAVGGAYLPATNSTHLIASIRVLSNGSIVIELGERGQGDVTVDAQGNSTVQVTVYNNSDLFTLSGCSNRTVPTSIGGNNETVNGEVVTPIISIVTEGVIAGSEEDNKEVTITYSKAPYGLSDGDQYVCARWNASVNCGGGGWTIKDCSLVVNSDGNFQCKCLHQGTFTLLDIPLEPTPYPPLTDQLPLISRIIFYVMSTASIPLYLTIIITVIATRELRGVPLTQSLLNQSLSQGLTFLILAISFERTEILGLCFFLGVALQYLYLVSLSWMVAQPVLMAIRIFKRLLYERKWLIIPFAALCWGVPAVPVTIYGGLRYDSLTQNTSSFNCWLESSLFPNTITYLTAISVLMVALAITLTILLFSCSDYKLESTTHFRLASLYPTLLFLSGVILTQYFTAAAPSYSANPYYILLGVGGCALLCGCYFFLANAMLNPKIRNPIFCREDPITRRKTAGYATTNKFFRSSRQSTEESEGESSQATPQYTRRQNKSPGALNLGYLNYVGDYLGGGRDLGRGQRSGVGTNPVPLSLFGQVQQSGQHGGRGARVAVKSGDFSGLRPNPAYRMDLSTEV